MLYDLHRLPAANESHIAHPSRVRGLFDGIDRLGSLEEARVGTTAADLGAMTVRALVSSWYLSLPCGTCATYCLQPRSVQSRNHLPSSSPKLSAYRQGDLSARSGSDLPGEFATLGEALDQTGESLTAVIRVATGTADQVAQAAN